MSRTKEYCTGPLGTVKQSLRHESSRVAAHLGESLAKTLSHALSCESQTPSDKPFSATVNIYDCSGSPKPGPSNKSVISFALVATRAGEVRHNSSPTSTSNDQREKADNMYDGLVNQPTPGVNDQSSFAPIPQVDLVAVSLSLD